MKDDICVCVCEFSDGKRRKEEYRCLPVREGCGVPRAEGTDPQVPQLARDYRSLLDQESTLKVNNPA